MFSVGGFSGLLFFLLVKDRHENTLHKDMPPVIDYIRKPTERLSNLHNIQVIDVESAGTYAPQE